MRKIKNKPAKAHRKSPNVVPIASPRMMMRHANLIGNMQSKEHLGTRSREDDMTFLLNGRTFQVMLSP
jgi:hypothetical protein